MDGCTYHRIFHKNNHTDHEVRTVNNITEADLEWCDVLNYSRHCLYAPEFLRQMATKHNFKIVVDCDDVWFTEEWHPLHPVWKDGRLKRQVEAHMCNADAVTVTHNRLRNLIIDRGINEKVLVLPNTIPFDEGQYNQYFFQATDKIRLLYASSPMNYINTRILKGVMKKLYKKYPNLEVVILGGTKGWHFDEGAKNLTDNGRIPNRIYQFQPVEDYMKLYEGDIMILPCVDNQFMSMKSNLKLLEAASQNLPVVCSRVDPYLGWPVEYAHGDNQWVEKISRLIDDVEYRKKCADSLAEYARDFYDTNKREHIYGLL